MRSCLSLFFISLLAVSCVKKTSSNPVPHIDYNGVYDMRLAPRGNDTAVIVLGYEDGDGNLFVDDYSQGPNLILKSYYYDSDSSKFLQDGNPFTYTIKQPDNGYYKGKAIKGEVYVHLSEFRSNNTRKIVKFDIFMKDMSKNNSNVVTSPVYTLNF